MTHVFLKGKGTRQPCAEGWTVLMYPHTASNNPSRRLVPSSISIPVAPTSHSDLRFLLGGSMPCVHGHRVPLLPSSHQPKDLKPLFMWVWMGRGSSTLKPLGRNKPFLNMMATRTTTAACRTSDPTLILITAAAIHSLRS